jgi:TonB family protein
MKCFRNTAVALLLLAITGGARGQPAYPRIRFAILSLGETKGARLLSERIEKALAIEPAILLIDRDLARTAAQGFGYSGSLNLTLTEARDLGAAIGSDFFLVGDAQTLRRSTSSRPTYFESYAALFLVSARTGRLIAWERPSFEAATMQDAETLLLNEISNPQTSHRYATVLLQAQADERNRRQLAVERNTPVVEEASGETSERSDLRLPRPYRRLRPAYPDTAARADAEGTVDVLVDLNNEGDVTDTEVVRWAGFGLDEATINTVRQLHFFPALRAGTPIPIRILLRYNFRKPPSK